MQSDLQVCRDYTLNGSCHLNRETARTVAEAGFNLSRVERYAGGIVQVIRATAYASPEAFSTLTGAQLSAGGVAVGVNPVC